MNNIGDTVYNWYNLETNFRIYLAAVKKISPLSAKNYLSDLRYFVGWAHQALPEQCMTADNLECYRDYLVASNLPPRTTNRRLSSIRAFSGFLLSQGIIKTNPSKGVRNFSHAKASD